jgi:UDP-N-acetylmuramoyl-tripeptide--D-alanyl-D-alanine ligase
MIQELYSIFLKHPEVCIDTRSINEGCLFFALKGPSYNANKFAIDALTKGAAYAVVDEEKYILDDRYILVDDVLTSLQKLANHHRKNLNCPVIAITGTNGKTTSKELLYRVLKQKFNTSATKRNLNNHIGVPLSLLSIKKDTEYAIIEMGANHIDEIAFLCTIAEPSVGVITNVGKAHLEGFGSLDGVLKAKTELFSYLGINKGVVFTKDNQQNLLELVPSTSVNFTYGQISSSSFTIKNEGAQPFLHVSVDDTIIKSKLIGDYNFDNIALSIAIGSYFGVELENIKTAIESYSPTNNRSQLIKTERNTILLDAYNANPMSLEKAILNMMHIEHDNKVLILGDMFELGEDSKIEHINIINHCLSSEFTEVYLVGEAFTSANKTKYPCYTSTEILLKSLQELKLNGAFILIKGSRGMKLEQLVEVL